MRKEMAFLPPMPVQSNEIQKISQDLSIGKNVCNLIPKDMLSYPFTIIAITLPTCAFCHSALETFLEKNKEHKIPFVNLLTIETGEGVEEFLDLYKDHFTIIRASIASIQSLLIEGFPAFLLVDQDGNIIQESGWSAPIIKSYYKRLNETSSVV